MIRNKVLKFLSFSIISTVLCTTIMGTTSVFANENVSKTKDNYYDKISRIYSNKSTQKEKIDYINLKINNPNKNVIKISEFNLYKRIDKQKGILPTQKNSMVRKYLDSIKNLSNKNINELKQLGYSDTRIKLLKESSSLISKNSSQLKAISLNSNILDEVGSIVTVSATLDGYYHDTAYSPTSPIFKTLIYVAYQWKWSEAPIVRDNDGFAVAFNTNNNLQIYYTNDGVGYYNAIDNSFYKDIDYSVQASNSESSNKNGLYFSFPMGLNSDTLYKKKYSLDGYSLNVLVNNNSYVDEFNISGLYAHSLDTTNPEFLLDNNGVQVSTKYSQVSTLYSTSKDFKYSDFDPNSY
ncbi:MAG: hypothetical protein K0R54_4295 [Clostridiaceae bacterium]|jgi:hypothetical protein|nr:hypothetical protein [Clostridiaceae bacterium]